jgi:hypothetical protein
MKNYADQVQDPECTEFEQRRLQVKEALIARFHKRNEDFNYLEKAIINESNREVLDYISEHVNVKLNSRSIILTTACYSYLDYVDFDNVRAIINFEPTISQTAESEKLIKAVNTLLPDAGIYIGISDDMAESAAICEEFICNGFEIIDLSLINKSLFFTAMKTGEISR